MANDLHCFNRFPKEHPYNRDGYRYVLAEADPHAPFRQVSIILISELNELMKISLIISKQ